MNKEEFLLRTKKFGLRVIRLVTSLPRGPISTVIGNQLLKSATSVGANYRSAVRGKSGADFISEAGHCRRRVLDRVPLLDGIC